MTSWTRELDEAAVLSTAKGYWHMILFYLLCGLAGIPTAIIVFAQVFTNDTPDHWCALPPEIQDIGLPADLLKNLTVPEENGHYDKCSTYVYDTNALLAALQNYSNGRTEIRHEGDALRIFDRSSVQSDELVDSEEQIINDIVLQRRKESCANGWTYSRQQYKNTLVTEFNLVCEKEWLTPFCYTLFWFGSMFGNVLFGCMSDRCGRRFTILFMIYLVVPLAIGTAFSNSYTTYTVLRLFSGLFFPALYQQPFVLAMELMPPSRRTDVGIAAGVLYSVGTSLLSLIAYGIRDWFLLSLATSVPFILLFSYYWLIPESPRWLAGNNRVGQAEKVIRTIARKNGIKLYPGFLLDIQNNIADKELFECNDENSTSPKGIKDVNAMNTMVNLKSNMTMVSETENKIETLEKLLPSNGKVFKNNIRDVRKDDLREDCNIDEDIQRITELRQKEMENSNNSTVGSIKSVSNKMLSRLFCKKNQDENTRNAVKDESAENNVASILDIFRYPIIRRNFLISTFNCLSIGVIYNSLSYNTSNLGVDDYMAFFISGVVEIPSYLLVGRCMERFGRRYVLCFSMLIGGISCLCCGLVPEDLPWVVVAFAMLGKLCAAASLVVSYVLIGELLPTVLRAQAIGLSSFITGLGLLACPYIAHLAVYVQTLPLVTMGVLGVMAGLMPLFVPETLNQPLPQTIIDGEKFGKKIKVFGWVVWR